MGFIAKRIPSQLFVVTDINNTQFSQNLCEFMHSMYEVIIFPVI
jgi:pantothenate kinase